MCKRAPLARLSGKGPALGPHFQEIRMYERRWVVLLAAALLAACDGRSRSDTSQSDGAAPAIGYGGSAKEAMPVATPAPGRGAAESRAGRAVTTEQSQAAPPPPPVAPPGQAGDSAAPSMIIRTGVATVEVDSLEPAVALVRQLAARVGGFVASTSVQTGRDQLRSATLEVKLPAARWDDAVRGLDPIGEVEFVQENAQDVGEEYVDVQARLANARRLETRLIELLARRTGKLEDVLAVERELARVREEIERAEGRMRWLRSLVSLSTLTITVHEPAPIVGAPGDSPIADAFRAAWRNFVNFVAWFIGALGWMIPMGLIITAAFLLLRRLRLARPRRGTPPDEGRKAA